MSYDSLHKRLHGKIAKDTAKELKISNAHAVPQIEKVVVNVGINKSKMDGKERIAYIETTLAQITGQKPVFTRARKAISNFKIRENMIVGAMVTLRGKRMEEFLDRLISYSIPRIRDFRGLSTKLDGHGNYSIGIRDHSIFPEVPPPDAGQIFGMQIQITTTTTSDEEAMVLLKEIGMPFRRKEAEEAPASAPNGATAGKNESKEAKGNEINEKNKVNEKNDEASASAKATAGKKEEAEESKEAEETKPLERPSVGAGDEPKESKEAEEAKADSSKLKAQSSKKEVVQEAIEFDEKKEDDSVEEKPVSPDTETAS